MVTAIPAGGTLLHVGLPKTGTTALQSAAATRRAELLGHGVCYPGRAMNHREAALARLGKAVGWPGDDEDGPPRRRWDELLTEIARAGADRTLVSHEFLCECDAAQIADLRDELGPELRVVITLRPFLGVLGSSWQQGVKAGRRRSYDQWLRTVLRGTADRAADDHPFYRRQDQGGVVARFCSVLGADRVVAVVVDKAEPTLLTDTFEDLLALPRGFLARPAVEDAASNRTLSLPEVEVLRALNGVAREHGVDYDDFDRLVRRGAVRRLMNARRPGADEPRIALPRWAVAPASERAAGYVEAIRSSGCQVVGDLAALTAPVPTGPRTTTPTSVPFEVTLELVSGLLSAALGQGSEFDAGQISTSRGAARLARTDSGRRLLAAADVTRDLTVPDLLRLTALRLVSRLRR